MIVTEKRWIVFLSFFLFQILKLILSIFSVCSHLKLVLSVLIAVAAAAPSGIHGYGAYPLAYDLQPEYHVSNVITGHVPTAVSHQSRVDYHSKPGLTLSFCILPLLEYFLYSYYMYIIFIRTSYHSNHRSSGESIPSTSLCCAFSSTHPLIALRLQRFVRWSWLVINLHTLKPPSRTDPAVNISEFPAHLSFKPSKNKQFFHRNRNRSN